MDQNLKTISELNPHKLWNYFAQLTAIPRPSKKEDQVREWIKTFAEERNLEYKVDKTGNIVIYKHSQNSQSNKKLLLQAHMDMVCENNPDVKIDFEKDPINLRIDGDYVYASGTTLGADNGIGLCTILCILDDKEISHPNIEALFTVDEETGLTGAMYLDSSLISADYMMNLDTEEEGSLYIGCAGSRDTVAEILMKKESPITETFQAYEIKIGGLHGGHSGANIHENRTNAIKLLGNLLYSLSEKHDIQLALLEGGNKRNAIPRDARAVFAFDEVNKDELHKYFDQIKDKAISAYQDIEPDLTITLHQIDAGMLWSVYDSKNIINLINSVHSGVYQMSTNVPGLVQTSNNFGVLRTTESGVQISCMTRSDNLYELNQVIKSLLSNIELALNFAVLREFSNDQEVNYKNEQAVIQVSHLSVPWKPEPKTEIINICKEVHKRVLGYEPQVKAIHAGLECGMIRKYLPECQIISFGPEILDAHSPTEHVSISSVEKFYNYTIEVIKELAR